MSDRVACTYPIVRKTLFGKLVAGYCKRDAAGQFDGKPMCLQHIRIEREHQKGR